MCIMTGSVRTRESQTLDVVSPFDGRLIDTITLQGSADADELLGKAKWEGK